MPHVSLETEALASGLQLQLRRRLASTLPASTLRQAYSADRASCVDAAV